MKRDDAAKRPPPKFFLMSSMLGSTSMQEAMEELKGVGYLSYGISKCGANFFAHRAHLEYAESGLVSVALHPGYVFL